MKKILPLLLFLLIVASVYAIANYDNILSQMNTVSTQCTYEPAMKGDRHIMTFDEYISVYKLQMSEADISRLGFIETKDGLFEKKCVEVEGRRINLQSVYNLFVI